MFRQLLFVSSCLVRWIKLRQATGSHLHVDIVSILVFSFFLPDHRKFIFSVVPILSVFESSLDVLLCCFQRANRRESIFNQEEEVSSFCFKPIVLRIRYFEVAFNWLSTLFIRNKSNDKAEFCYSRISIKFA